LALFEPRSRGLPEGFLDQPFHGWVFSRIYSARFRAGFGFSHFDAKAFLQKHADEFVFTPNPTLKAPV